MSKHKGDSQEEAECRQRVLAGIYEKYGKKNEDPSDKQLIDDLKKAGYKISRATLYRDKGEIFRDNTFVEDVAGKTYSYIIHRCFEDLQFAKRKAKEILAKKWTNSKVVTKETENGKIIEETITKEIAGPHLQALRLIMDIVMSINNLINGNTLQVSAALWTKHTDNQEKEIQNLQIENQELKELVGKLKAKESS